MNRAIFSCLKKYLVLSAGAALLGLCILYLYLHTAPAIAPTIDSPATTTPEQVATTSANAEEEFGVESNLIPLALDIKPWKLVTANYVDGSTFTPTKVDVFSIRFNSSGAFTAETDCNGISGSYEARSGSLSLGSIAATKMFCEGSQEAEFTALLSDVVSYRFTNDSQLIMATKNGSEVIFK